MICCFFAVGSPRGDANPCNTARSFSAPDRGVRVIGTLIVGIEDTFNDFCFSLMFVCAGGMQALLVGVRRYVIFIFSTALSCFVPLFRSKVWASCAPCFAANTGFSGKSRPLLDVFLCLQTAELPVEGPIACIACR